MKPRTYFGLALLFPYILWGMCALIIAILSAVQEVPETWNIVLMPLVFYTFGIILWFVPYTLLAIGMWMWSRNKSTAVLYKLALLAPILLFALMLLEVVLVSLPTSGVIDLTNGLPGQLALVGGFSLVFGYLSVGIALGVFKFIQSRHRIAEEIPAAVSEADQTPTLS